MNKTVQIYDNGTLIETKEIEYEEAPETTNERTMRERAESALENLRAYRNLATPTNAQTIAAVKTLCAAEIALIRLVLGKLEATD